MENTNEILDRKYPILYKKTSTGAIQQWEIGVFLVDKMPTIISRFGQVGGKIQESREQVLVGKNTGKKNATTALEQADSQAESTWKKQLKKGYVKTVEEAQAGVVDEIIEGGIAPMLAHKFSEQGHKIKYPALAQPKLDGHRCTTQYNYIDGDITMWSRTRKPILSSPHIIRTLQDKLYVKHYGATLNANLNRLDGELYNHEYHNNFEDLTSLIRQEVPKEGYENIQYHVYDIPHPTATNYERYLLLEDMRQRFEGTSVHIVETLIVNNEDELMEAFEHFLAEGYEGCMVRNADGLYVNKRSYDLQKVKNFSDSEYKIIGIKVGTKGSMAGKAIFICETDEGIQFAAKMIGKIDELIKYVNNPNLAIGRMLTVKYQGFTNKNNVPRFPVAMRIRNDI